MKTEKKPRKSKTRKFGYSATFSTNRGEQGYYANEIKRTSFPTIAEVKNKIIHELKETDCVIINNSIVILNIWEIK